MSKFQGSREETPFQTIQHPEPQVLVVGAGAAGLTVARSLAERGIAVEVLEFGPLPSPDDFTTNRWPDEFPFRGLGDGGAEAYCPDHLTPARNAPYRLGREAAGAFLKRVRVAGGKTLYWTGHAPRFGDLEFHAATTTGGGEDWPISYADLAPHYERIERLIGVAGTVEGLRQHPDGVFLPPFELRPGERILQAALAKKGVRMIPARKAILTNPLNGRPACRFDGRCFLGCETGAKFDAYSGLFPRTPRAGFVRLRPNSVVLEVVSDKNGRVAGARVADRRTKRVETVRARVVVLAASAVETARLLLNSRSPDGGHGLANSSGLVGRYLSESVGVDLDGLLPPLKNAPVGDIRSTGEHGLVPRFVNLSPKSREDYSGGFLFVTRSGPDFFPGYARKLPGFGEEFKRAVRAWYPAPIRLQGIGSVGSRRENRITTDPTKPDDWGRPTAKAVFSLSDEDRRLWRAMADAGLEFLDAAGAEYASVNTSEAETGGGLHACGTCRMGTDPKTSVVNSFGQTHDIKNLFVADASIFVSALNQPTLTIMALALRCADFIAEMLRIGH